MQNSNKLLLEMLSESKLRKKGGGCISFKISECMFYIETTTDIAM